MRHLFTLILCIATAVVQQSSDLELTPQGFATIELKTPNKPLENLIEASKSWAFIYNKDGFDITNVTENSLTIDAKNESAFFNYNVGVRYNYDIKYSLKIIFKEDKRYSMNFTVKEIYTENVLQKITPTDFFNADGKLKEDYRDAKPSLENTASKIIQSYSKFIAQK